MRQRIGVESLNKPITIEDVEQINQKQQSYIEQLSDKPKLWLAFCNEKLALATETVCFLLRQTLSNYRRGFPSQENHYLQRIEAQMTELKSVYVSFYHFAPGLIFQLKESQPEIYVWLMMQEEFGQDVEHLISGLMVASEIDKTMANVLIARSQLVQLDRILAELIDGNASGREIYFEFLRIRQTLTTSLIKHWIETEKVTHQRAYPVLALYDNPAGIEWIEQNSNYEQWLFERIITKSDRNTWFRIQFGTQPSAINSPKIMLFAKLLELKEFEEIDITASYAPVAFALCGDWKLVPSILERLLALEESEGEIWIQALYVVYGERLPLKPSDVGVEYEWEEICQKLVEWQERDGHQQNLPSRLGFALSFESTLKAMQDQNITAEFRQWLWYQLCIQSRVYIPWDMTMPRYQQDWNFTRLRELPSASERFELRNQNAVVGY